MVDENRDPFSILEISPDAEPDVIAASYRALVRRYRPGANVGASGAGLSEKIGDLYWAKAELDNDLEGWRDRISGSATASSDRKTKRYLTKPTEDPHDRRSRSAPSTGAAAPPGDDAPTGLANGNPWVLPVAGFVGAAAAVAIVLSIVAIVLSITLSGGDDDDGLPIGVVVETPAPNTAEVDALAAMFFPESGRVALREAIEQGIIDDFLFVDGTKSQSMFDDLGAVNFEGMYGTQPGAPNETFAAAFSVAGGDPDFPFVRESYDAAYVLALAAVAANSTAGADIAAHLPFVSNPPGEEVGFGADEFARAVGLLAAGDDINFVGASGPVDFDVNGDLASGAVEVWKIVDGKITFQEAHTADLAAQSGVEVPEGTLTPAATAPTEALKLGSIMAVTGDLSDFGPPIEAAVEFAVSEINAGGGAFGLDVELAKGDSGTNADTGQSEATRLIEIEGVHAIIGALASGVTQPIAENVAAPAGVVMISPSSTAPAITTADDDGLLFRTPIPDDAQGQVLADLAIDLGYTTVCTMFVNTAYGQGLSEVFTENFEAAGGSVPEQVAIEQEQTSYVTELRRCVGE